MTVRQTLDGMREELNGQVVELFLCKFELFYQLKTGRHRETVYPVSRETAAEEAEFFGVEWQEV